MNRIKEWLCLGIAGFFIQTGSAENLTYIDILNRLQDLEYLAALPKSAEQCRQWSSYDRSSRYDQVTGKYVNWEANSDGFGGQGWIRVENDKLVLAEIEGPGCIWRTWSATPKDGHVRIYLDGASEPAVDLPFVDYFNGTVAPFNRPALVHLVASGKNNYTPIPFQKSCKIIADRDYGEFHHFTYTVFPKDTHVPTFSMDLSLEENEALDRVNTFLENCGPDSFKTHPDQRTETVTIQLDPGAQKSVSLEGKQAILSLKVRTQIPADIEAQRKMLRELALQITWDGQTTPAVWTPLGDFFGTGPGANLYRSLPIGMTEKEFYSNWYMPFEKSAEIVLFNEGSSPRHLTLEIVHAPHSMASSEYGQFHAKWHRDAFLPEEKERWIDWTMLKTSGKGRFCGVALMIWNPRGGWWGEGDEKFFVDGEKFPSTYGTGSEDYFGYAWSDPQLFQNAYHNQTISEYNKGHISVNRWHVADNVPFQTSFEGTIEKYYPNKRPTQYACTVYWYLAPGGKDPYSLIQPDERIDYYAELTYPMEILDLLVVEKPAGVLEEQHMGSFKQDKWRDDKQVWWTGRPGGTLKIQLNIAKAGTYKILTRLTKAADYGIVQFYLDEKKINQPIDLYYPEGVVATQEIELGTFPLEDGKHILTIEIVGANPEAIKRYMVGIDYVDIKRSLF